MHSNAKKAGFLLTGALVAGGLAVPAVQAAPTTDPDRAFAAPGAAIIDDVVDHSQRSGVDRDKTSEPTPEPTEAPTPTPEPEPEPALVESAVRGWQTEQKVKVGKVAKDAVVVAGGARELTLQRNVDGTWTDVASYTSRDLPGERLGWHKTDRSAAAAAKSLAPGATYGAVKIALPAHAEPGTVEYRVTVAATATHAAVTSEVKTLEVVERTAHQRPEARDKAREKARGPQDGHGRGRHEARDRKEPGHEAALAQARKDVLLDRGHKDERASQRGQDSRAKHGGR